MSASGEQILLGLETTYPVEGRAGVYSLGSRRGLPLPWSKDGDEKTLLEK